MKLSQCLLRVDEFRENHCCAALVHPRSMICAVKYQVYIVSGSTHPCTPMEYLEVCGFLTVGCFHKLHSKYVILWWRPYLVMNHIFGTLLNIPGFVLCCALFISPVVWFRFSWASHQLWYSPQSDPRQRLMSLMSLFHLLRSFLLWQALTCCAYIHMDPK